MHDLAQINAANERAIKATIPAINARGSYALAVYHGLNLTRVEEHADAKAATFAINKLLDKAEPGVRHELHFPTAQVDLRVQEDNHAAAVLARNPVTNPDAGINETTEAAPLPYGDEFNGAGASDGFYFPFP